MAGKKKQVRLSKAELIERMKTLIGEDVMPAPEYMDSIKETVEFQQSPRGRFIMAQALYYGIKKLAEVDGPLREVSNICDMKYLLDVLYPGYDTIFDHIEQQRVTLLNGREV